MAETPDRPDASRHGLTAFETALLAGGVALFLALLYLMHEMLSPPVVAAAGVILLWPLRQQKTVRALFVSGGFLVGLWFLVHLRGILIPFVLVYLVAYLLDPAAEYLRQRWKIPRAVSSMAITLLVLGVIALVVILVVPNIVSQVQALAMRLLNSVSGLRQWLTDAYLLDRLDEYGLIEKDRVAHQVTTILQDQLGALTDRLPQTVQMLVQSLSSILSILTLAGILPVVLYYTLKDFRPIRDRLVELFPKWDGRRDYLIRSGSIVGNYVRGLVTISLIAMVNVGTALTILGVPFGLLIGVMAGLLNMIPNLGAYLTAILGVLIAVTFGDPPLLNALYVIIVLLGQAFLEGSVLTPVILSQHVGLHPVLILLALFIFGSFLGIIGLLIAVPATALIMTFYKAYRDDWQYDLAGPPAAARSVSSRLRRWREEQKERLMGRERDQGE